MVGAFLVQLSCDVCQLEWALFDPLEPAAGRHQAAVHNLQRLLKMLKSILHCKKGKRFPRPQPGRVRRTYSLKAKLSEK